MLQPAGKARPRSRKSAFSVPPLQPALAGDAVLFDSILDYSYDGNPDLLWAFPTRGYDESSDPVFLGSNPVGADSLWPNSPKSRSAQLTLFQIGQPALISAMTFQGALQNGAGYYATGSVAILFFDGVYDGPNGLPYTSSGASLTQKLATAANGANGYLVRFPNLVSNFHFYTVSFDGTGGMGVLAPYPPGNEQPMRITDPLGRFGVLIAAAPDGTALGTAKNIWTYDRGAPNGLNRAYLYQNYNFTQAAAGSNTVALKPSATGKVTGSALIPGGAAYAALPDGDCNAGRIVPGPNFTFFSPDMPLNPYMTFYGRKLDGAPLTTGELRGRIRNQGFDPDSKASHTFVPSGGKNLPGERRPLRYRFTFITPPIAASEGNAATIWNPKRLPPGHSVAHQQEFYAQPSYGPNNDGANAFPPQADTAVRLNYRLRGIPVGSYSLLAQQIPVYGAAASGGTTTLVRDTLTPPEKYPGSDYVSAFVPLLTIAPSAASSGYSPDAYANPTVLDIKLHLPPDLTSFTNGKPDGVVDVLDFGMLVNEYGNIGLPGDFASDIIGFSADSAPDGQVDVLDFGALVNAYGDPNQIPESDQYP